MSALRSFLRALVARLTRRQKAGILLAVDAALAPLALAILGAANGTWPGWPVALAAMAAGLAGSLVLGLHRIKLCAFDGQALGRSGAAAALVAGMLWATPGGPPVPVMEFGLALFLLSLIVRAIMREGVVALLRMGQPGTRVMIYGAGNTGVQLAAALRGHARIHAVAFADDSPALQGLTVAGLRVYAPDRIAALTRELRIDRVLLAMPSAAPARVALLVRRLRDLGLDTAQVPSFAELAGSGAGKPSVPGEFLGRESVEVGAPAGTAAYAGQVVMVTGAGGSVGSELCRQLLSMGPARLVLFEMAEYALYTIDRELHEAGAAVEIVPVLGSVTDGQLLRDVMQAQGVTVVLHAAAYKHVPLVEANPVAGLANNVLGTRTLAEAAVDCGVRRFVLVSSDKAVRPTNVMGATKRAAELVVQDIAGRARGTSFAMVRFGNVLGSSGSVIPLFRAQIARGGPVTLTHADVTRYFMTMDEAARLVLLAGSFAGAERAGRCDVYVLDMGNPVRIRDLAAQMIAAAGHTLRDAANPDGEIEIVVTGLRPGEKLHEELLIGDGLLPTPHPKILRAAERGLSELQTATLLREVRAAVAAGDPAAARAVIFDHVEGPGQPVAAVAAE